MNIRESATFLVIMMIAAAAGAADTAAHRTPAPTIRPPVETPVATNQPVASLKTRLLINADTANEVDDLYAITRALIEPSFDVVGLSSAQWQVSHYATPNTLEDSQRLNEVLLALLNKNHIPHPRGAAMRLCAGILPGIARGLDLRIESQQNIFAPGTNNLWAVSPHASTIAQTTGGVIVAAWWAGEAERMPGNDVWMSRFVNGSWTTPYKAADGDEIEKDYTVENPTLFQPVGGPLMLFYYAGIPKRKDVDKYGRQMWGFLKTSTDNGATWSPARALGNDARIEGGKLVGPTKNPPIQLEDGSILLPCNNEPALLSGGMDEKIWAKSHKWHFEKSTDMGKTWFVVTILPENRDFNAIQPGFLRLGGGKLLALGRNEGKGAETPYASSSDNGQTWSGIRGMASLPQTHAGICPRTLSDGSHICILNPSTDWRNRLDLMTSTDGLTWKLALILNPSEDGYMAHYPQAVQTSDGKLHVVFSYGKRDQPNTSVIRHMVVATGLKGGQAR